MVNHKRKTELFCILILISFSSLFSSEITKEDIIAANTHKNSQIQTSIITQKISFFQNNNLTDYFYIIYNKNKSVRIEMKNNVNDEKAIETFIYDGTDYWKIKAGMKEKLELKDKVYQNTVSSSWLSLIENPGCVITTQNNEIVQLNNTINKDNYEFIIQKKDLSLQKITVTSNNKNVTVVINDFYEIEPGYKVIKDCSVFENDTCLYKIDMLDIQINHIIPDDYFNVSKIKKFNLKDAINNLF